jgi:CHAT domain-containing protein
MEVETIKREFNMKKQNAKVFLKDSASEYAIKQNFMNDFKIIHFATHGFVNSEKPELSGILLAQDSLGGEDGILYSGEIYHLKLNADLVVLSACETGLGRLKKGEGIIGLTRALLYAGTKNIIVSLWQVSDQSTSDLMISFYRNLLNSRKNESYSNWLRDAKIKMINEGDFSHPFYWSSFIVIGN